MAKRIEPTVRVEGDLTKLKPGEGVEGYEYASSLETEGVRLNDPSTGKTVSIRVFEFKMNPDAVKNFPTDHQHLFNAHAKQIQTILWGDGLRPLDEFPPRVIIKKKERKYQIFVPCEARLNTMYIEKPGNLSKLINKNADTRH